MVRQRPTGRILDVTEPMRVTVRVEEQHDADGDLCWAVTVCARTYSQRRLAWLAETLGCDLDSCRSGSWRHERRRWDELLAEATQRLAEQEAEEQEASAELGESVELDRAGGVLGPLARLREGADEARRRRRLPALGRRRRAAFHLAEDAAAAGDRRAAAERRRRGRDRPRRATSRTATRTAPDAAVRGPCPPVRRPAARRGRRASDGGRGRRRHPVLGERDA